MENTLQQTVRETIKNYFKNIGNEDPVDFYSSILLQIEKPMLEFLINYTNYNQVEMAKILGIARGTIRKKLKQCQLL